MNTNIDTNEVKQIQIQRTYVAGQSGIARDGSPKLGGGELSAPSLVWSRHLHCEETASASVPPWQSDWSVATFVLILYFPFFPHICQIMIRYVLSLNYKNTV